MAEACFHFLMDRTCLARGLGPRKSGTQLATEPLVHKLSGQKQVFHIFMDRACLARGFGHEKWNTVLPQKLSHRQLSGHTRVPFFSWTEPVWQEALVHEKVEHSFCHRNSPIPAFGAQTVFHFFMDRTCLARGFGP